jgi:hypothetical protein
MWHLTASNLSCTGIDVALDRFKAFRTDIVLDLARILCGNPRINPKHRQPVG